MASTYLTRTNSSPTNAKKYTWSSWNKIDSGGWYPFFSNTNQGGHSYIGFGASSSSFGVIEHGDSAGTLYYLSTSSIQRDSSGWYHVVVQFDSTQSTASNRVKIYINNELQTSFGNSDYPSQNLDSWLNTNGYTIEIGRRSQGSGQYYSGIISHAHFIDGTIYAPSTFGETDSTTGEWKINSNPGISTANYGNNGFWMFKDNNSLNDNSGNGNNFSLGGGTLTKTEDCPSNNFATLNKLSSKGTFSYGNTEVEHSTGGTTYETTTTTLGMTSGKYYCEAKITYDNNYPGFGIASTNSIEVTKLESDWLGKTSNSYGYFLDGVIYNNGSTIASGQSTFATNDIIGMALDLDSAQNTLKFYKNGSLVNTTNITTNSNGWFFGTTHNNTKTAARSKFNFGNGYFRSDAVSSAGTNASNNGIFEYDVPSGYTALSTKGLNL
tara:strand:+ start:28 stop:1338 length:1311 start_codon:yes stop_codon:yes gene_type:complete